MNRLPRFPLVTRARLRRQMDALADVASSEVLMAVARAQQTCGRCGRDNCCEAREAREQKWADHAADLAARVVELEQAIRRHRNSMPNPRVGDGALWSVLGGHGAQHPVDRTSCVERWPECETGAYDPRCCRFPKSCSADVHYEADSLPQHGVATGGNIRQQALDTLRSHGLDADKLLPEDGR